MSDAQAPGKPGRVKIRLPETYKTDESVWEELEKYLYTGFLTATSFIAGKSFVFKTLNFNELRNIDFMRPTRSSVQEVRDSYRNIFIAHSVFMVDGTNVLYDRPGHIHKLSRVISRLPIKVKDKIIDHLSALNQKVSRLHPMVDVYAYENRSRFRWFQIQGTPINSSISTGIPGTDHLGMNTSQALWTAVNRILDRRDEMDKDWSNAKFIGSCFAGKGIRSIDERDKARSERERVEREDHKIRVLHKYLNRLPDGEEPEETIPLPDGRKAVVVRGNASDGKWRADSAEELRDQLEKALSGEKDHHDLVIEKKQRELVERSRTIEEERNLVFRSPPLLDSGESIAGGGSRVFGSKEEADAHVARMIAMRNEQILRMSRAAEVQENSDENSESGGLAPRDRE